MRTSAFIILVGSYRPGPVITGRVRYLQTHRYVKLYNFWNYTISPGAYRNSKDTQTMNFCQAYKLLINHIRSRWKYMLVLCSRNPDSNACVVANLCSSSVVKLTTTASFIKILSILRTATFKIHKIIKHCCGKKCRWTGEQTAMCLLQRSSLLSGNLFKHGSTNIKWNVQAKRSAIIPRTFHEIQNLFLNKQQLILRKQNSLAIKCAFVRYR